MGRGFGYKPVCVLLGDLYAMGAGYGLEVQSFCYAKTNESQPNWLTVGYAGVSAPVWSWKQYLISSHSSE